MPADTTKGPQTNSYTDIDSIYLNFIPHKQTQVGF